MSILFTPHLTSPKGGEIFNLGKVNITWDINEPPVFSNDPYLDIDVTSISYEIEYTESYSRDNTVWHTLKRRILSTETSFNWIVGKMIKSSSVRVRIRAKNSLNGEFSEWSMSSGNFSINIFKLIAPAIVSPIGKRVYTDFILIILDETLVRNTFNQKVRYTLEYSSDKAGIPFTVIAKNIPVGQNVIRWDLDGLIPADDYVLRLTAKNASVSCLEGQEPVSDQISKKFVYDLKIQQPGMFLIDTKPPKVILDIESSTGITNELIHTLNIFSEDETSDVEQIQIRECDSSTQIPLGNIDTTSGEENTTCTSIEEILANNPDFGNLIGKPLGYSTKTQWTFEDKSGQRKLEAIVTDSGGNTSIQNLEKSFIPIFRHNVTINDIVVVTEARNETVITEANDQFSLSQTIATFEVAYLVTSDGEYLVLEPYPRLIAKTSFGRDLKRVTSFSGHIYILTYVNNSTIIDTGSVFRDDKTVITFLFNFPNALSIPSAVAEFSDILYIGLENGELWSWNNVSFSLVKTFSNPISTLIGDNSFLYVGLNNSSLVTLYNGTDFFVSDVEV